MSRIFIENPLGILGQGTGGAVDESFDPSRRVVRRFA